MQETTRRVSPAASRISASQFNFNKLQAVVCMASSAVCSIGLIYWAIKALG